MKQVTLYLAGPDIFLPDAEEHAAWQKHICRQYNFVPLHPLDNNIGLQQGNREVSRKIFRSDIAQIHNADVTVANCNYFRGGCIDDGTGVELGYTFAKGKVAYGYIRSLVRAHVQIPQHYECHQVDGQLIDKDGYLIVEDFGTAVNLMVHELIEKSGGKLIEGDFEDAIRHLRADIDSGALRIKGRGRQ